MPDRRLFVLNAVDFVTAALDRLASRPRLAVLLLGLFTSVGAALVTLIEGIPAPGIHDEFAYLLHADTFASGRVTNPTHPLWPHFETFHEIFQPTYTAKYPPAQGLILALGQILGHPIIGVWISVGLMTAAVTWMLFAWVSPRWAVVGGLLAACQIGIASYWAQSYWGGAVAAVGGALLYGALRRLLTRPRWADGALLGLGLAILANSRPLEGFLVSLPAAGALLWAFVRRSGPDRKALAGSLLSTVAVLMLTAAMMGYYNWRTTGDTMRMPYQVWTETYAVHPFFFWQDGPEGQPPQYRFEGMRRYYETYVDPIRESLRVPQIFLEQGIQKSWRLLLFFLGPGIAAIVAAPWILRRPWTGFAAGVCAGFVALSLIMPAWPHYLAPVMGLVLVLETQALGAILAREKPIGTAMVCLILALIIVAPIRMLPIDDIGFDTFNRRRTQIMDKLRSSAGKDLVIVEYGPHHSVHFEWVFNEADIDGADIVWARSGADMERLIEYYEGRRIWSLDVLGNRDPVLQPLSITTTELGVRSK